MVLDWAVGIADRKRGPICITGVKERVSKVRQELAPTPPPTLTCSAPRWLLHRAGGRQGHQPAICHRAQVTEAKAHLGAHIFRDPPQTPDRHPLLLR